MTPRGIPQSIPRPGERLRLVASSCRIDRIDAHRPGSPRTLCVRPAAGAALPVEGECFELEVAETWRDGSRLWLSGRLGAIRLDVAALGLEPLSLVELGPWDPGRDQLSELALGPARRSEYELERIPAAGPDGAGPETILHRAIDLWAGNDPGAPALLGDLLRRDLRCLAAHSALGFFAFNGPPELGGAARARRHYEVGLAIAGLSVPSELAGVLPWERLGNRPFLRCLYGRSICLWRQGDLAGARAGLRRLCRLNPGDQLAARLALERIERHRP